jgi:prevent-host-death family protein
MKSVGIREAKARLSELARAAAEGKPTLLTDYGKPLAIIGAIPESEQETQCVPSDFREALLALPHELSVDF